MKVGGFSLHTESTNITLDFQERQSEPTTSGSVSVRATVHCCLLGRHGAGNVSVWQIQKIQIQFLVDVSVTCCETLGHVSTCRSTAEPLIRRTGEVRRQQRRHSCDRDDSLQMAPSKNRAKPRNRMESWSTSGRCALERVHLGAMASTSLCFCSSSATLYIANGQSAVDVLQQSTQTKQLQTVL